MEQSWTNEGDLDAARNLIAGHDLLSHDPYTKRVVESGKADNGESIGDLGNFLSARAAFLEQRKAEVALAAAERKDRGSYDAAVTYSVDPEQERAWVS